MGCGGDALRLNFNIEPLHCWVKAPRNNLKPYPRSSLLCFTSPPGDSAPQTLFGQNPVPDHLSFTSPLARLFCTPIRLNFNIGPLHCLVKAPRNNLKPCPRSYLLSFTSIYKNIGAVIAPQILPVLHLLSYYFSNAVKFE